MLQSMTGFGRTEFTIGDYTCSLEIKSLNGKQFEINSKIPPILKSYEIELRNLVQEKLTRGSVEVSIFLKQHGVSKPMSVNVELAKYYYESMQKISSELKLPINDGLHTLMQMPDVVGSVSEIISEEQWANIYEKLKETCDILNTHRKQEGVMLTKHISENIHQIKSLCVLVTPHEKNRLERVKEKINSSIQEFIQSANVDKNRLEQEIIFYIEKMDITEEKNRLLHHCEYFHSMLQEETNAKGKKLGFLLQEIGREINTLGSKANDVHIQKLVVAMKDELEQAKEQLLNAL